MANAATFRLAEPEDQPFWRAKTLDAMSAAEWESLCDGCGRCCLVKLEDEDTGEIAYTDVGCTLLDGESLPLPRLPEPAGQGARLRPPDARRPCAPCPGCRRPAPIACSARARDLYWWHPLVSGDPETVHAAGISVRGRVAGPEEDFTVAELLDRITDWPMEDPGA